jgi:HlyD family secretion protein
MKRKRIIRIVVVGVLILGVVGAGVYFLGGSNSANTVAQTGYTVAELSVGDLEKSITGTGTLSADGSRTQNTPVALTIDAVAVNAGQSVKAGDAIATVDLDALSDTIATLRSELETLDHTIAQNAAQQQDEVKLTSPIAGRVKQILAAEGDDAAELMRQQGGLVVLSTDGLMKLTITLSDAAAVEAGDEVAVTVDDEEYDGLVQSVGADGNCTITLGDNGPALGVTATVEDMGGNALGSGELAINQPYTVAATTGGIVDDINVQENGRVSTRTRLMTLIGVPVSDTYQDNVVARNQKLDAINEVLAIQEVGFIATQEDGIVNMLSIADGQQIEAGNPLVTLYTGGTATLVVSVDELDIAAVEVGQSATVTVDAIEGSSYQAKVQSISQVGTASSGVTTYDVELKLADSTGLRIGMNATATIVIERREGVLLLPLEALQISRGEQYVWLYTGSLPTDSTQNPGTRTVVQTGLSNATHVEVTEGLTQEDQVVVVRTAASADDSSQNGSFGGMGGFGGDWMPSGGGMGERPAGGGRQGD